MIAPGKTLGMLGGGQLGRMFALAARAMGYQVVVLDPAPVCPAGEVASRHIVAAYDDPDALRQLGEACDVVTTEFENVPAESLDFLARFCPVHPNAAAVAVAQDRRSEKAFMRGNGIAVGPYAVIDGPDGVAAAAAQVTFPAVLKTARFGYDGKGQVVVRHAADLAAAHAELRHAPCVLEQFLPLKVEVSVIVARSAAGDTAVYPLSENRHENGILDISLVPARVSASLAERARDTALRIVEAMDYVGVMGVEFFVLADDTLYVNEVAPRPHNSGHYTQDACATSQFEQQVRAVCGAPLGDVSLTRPVAMLNLLGDLWAGGEPDWRGVLARPAAKLHLYGKREARPGRKMAHVNCLADSPAAALADAEALKAFLAPR